MEEFYCKVCKVQMNSQYMWDSHINGKKHIKKANKDPDADTYDNASEETIPADEAISIEEAAVGEFSNENAKIETSLKDVSEPVIGLDYIIEIQYPDSDIHPSYSCTLCKCTIGMVAVVDHITSTKHRMNYVEQVDKDGFNILEHMQSSGVPLDGLADVRAASLEQKYGRGKVKVKQEKSKFGSISGMRKNRPIVNENLPPPRSAAVYSDYQAIELGPAQMQFLTQIPYFELNTKLQMLEQLTNLDFNNDNEAKDAMNMVTCLTNLLGHYKKALLTIENPAMSRRPVRDMEMDMPSRDMGMPPRNAPMGMQPRNPMGMPPRNSPMGMPTRDAPMDMPMNMYPRDGRMPMPARDLVAGGMRDYEMGSKDIRQSFNEPIGYPQPVASRAPYNSGGPNYQASFGNYPSY